MQIVRGGTSGQGGENANSKIFKTGHLGNHKLTVSTGRLFNEDIVISMEKKEKITGDKTVPDGHVAQLVDQFGRTFFLRKKSK